MKLSIIIPFYNEEATISEVITNIKKLNLGTIEKEIIVVDDGSTDQGLQLAKAQHDIMLIEHPKNLGKGAAVASGIEKVSGDFVIVQDADLELDSHDIKSILDKAISENAQVVYGSRNLNGTSKNRSPVFFWGGRMVTVICNILFGTELTDEACGYKLFRRELLQKVKFHSKGFSWEPEITAKLAKRGVHIFEVPVSYNPRSKHEGKKLNISDGIHACWTLIKYRFVD